MRSLVILGAGGVGREVYWYAASKGIEEIIFVDETVGHDARLVWGQRSHRVVNDWAAFQSDPALSAFHAFVVAVGDPALKRRLVSSALAHGLTPAATLVHDDARVYGADCSIGKGGIIAPGARVTTNVTIGDYVLLGVNCAVGHDVVIGDFVTCNPGCQISGNVTVGPGALIGTGACVREKLSIARDVVVGAQACVVRNVDDSGTTLVGVPARLLERHDRK